jgi:hypothetical protein
MEVLWQFIDRHAADARRAFVLAHLLQCALQVGPFQHLGRQRLEINRLGLSDDRTPDGARNCAPTLCIRSMDGVVSA